MTNLRKTRQDKFSESFEFVAMNFQSRFEEPPPARISFRPGNTWSVSLWLRSNCGRKMFPSWTAVHHNYWGRLEWSGAGDRIRVGQNAGRWQHQPLQSDLLTTPHLLQSLIRVSRQLAGLSAFQLSLVKQNCHLVRSADFVLQHSGRIIWEWLPSFTLLPLLECFSLPFLLVTTITIKNSHNNRINPAAANIPQFM